MQRNYFFNSIIFEKLCLYIPEQIFYFFLVSPWMLLGLIHTPPKNNLFPVYFREKEKQSTVQTESELRLKARQTMKATRVA